VRLKTILSIGPILFTAMMVAVAAATQLPIVPMWLFAGLVAMAVLFSIGMAMNRFSFKGLYMAVTAYTPCTETDPTYTPGADCIDEGSGILGILLVKKGFNVATAITDATTYGTAKTAKDLIPIKDIEAYWPAVTPVFRPGLAGRVEQYSHANFDLPFKHEGVDANIAFWNNTNHRRNYGVVFITEEYKAFAPLDRQLEPVLVSIFAAPASEQEFGKQRFFQGNIKWKHTDLVYYLDNLTTVILKPDFQV
jgi:hypothetical protein